jgi:POT family proton-dependent oligopeptide transporter
MNLFALFSIAALDKFSFNGIRSLLVMYLVTHLHFLAADSYKSYASIMALGYMMPLVCGYVSDHFKYSPQILTFSGLWAGLGMLALLLPWSWGFYLGMAGLVIASGFIKTTVPSLVGNFAKLHNKNEDALFAKLYMSFNIGSLLGTICCSVVGEVFGWNYGFMIAGIAMLIISLLSFSLSMNKTETLTIHKNFSQKLILPFKVNSIIFTLILVTILLLNYQSGLSALLYVVFAIALSILLYRSWKDSKINSKNIFYLAYLMIIHSVFFALYEQGSLSLVVFTDKIVNRSPEAFLPFLSNFHLFSNTFQIPVTFFQTIDPILNILMGGFFVKVWEWVAAEKPNLSFVAKFCIGLLFIALAFVILATCGGSGSLVSPWLLIITYLFFVLGEQCVVPIGFSAVSSLSPKQFLAFSMGVWFVAAAVSETLAEYISVWISPTSIHAGLAEYQKSFLNVGLIVAAITFGFYIVYRLCLVVKSKRFIAQALLASAEVEA